MSSPIFARAVEDWRALRAEWLDTIEAKFLQAEDACRGNLLNKRGRRAGIDPKTLFYGPEVRALAYASEELIDHWATHPRLTFAEYERHVATDHLALCVSCGEAAMSA